MKKLTKFFSGLLLFLMVSDNIAFATTSNTNISGKSIGEKYYYEYYKTYDEGNLEYKKITYLNNNFNNVIKSKIDSSIINPQYAPAYEYGSVRIVETRGIENTRYANTTMFGTVNAWYYRVLSIAGIVVTKNLGSFIITTAGALGVEIDASSEYALESYFSRDRVSKQVQVYTEDRIWKTYYTSVNREWYTHMILADNNTGEDKLLNCTYHNGFNPANVEEAPHFDDENYLINIAKELYRTNSSPRAEYGF